MVRKLCYVYRYFVVFFFEKDKKRLRDTTIKIKEKLTNKQKNKGKGKKRAVSKQSRQSKKVFLVLFATSFRQNLHMRTSENKQKRPFTALREKIDV